MSDDNDDFEVYRGIQGDQKYLKRYAASTNVRVDTERILDLQQYLEPQLAKPPRGSLASAYNRVMRDALDFINLTPKQLAELEDLAREKAYKEFQGKFSNYIINTTFYLPCVCPKDLSAANRNHMAQMPGRANWIERDNEAFSNDGAFDDGALGNEHYEDVPVIGVPVDEDEGDYDSEWETLHTYMQALDSIHGPTVVKRR
jgi:hypothetical protein